MKVMLLIFCFTVASVAYAGDSIFDLRERLQFSKNSHGKVTFQYCKLSQCEFLSARPIGKEYSNAASQLPTLPTGIAKQMLAHALATGKPHDFEVGGAISGDDHFRWANCSDKRLQNILSKAKKEQDFLIRFDTTACSRSDVTNTSVTREAEILRNALKELIH
jgi:hypothetical protein